MSVMPLICCSSGAATVSAISSAVAPGYSALTETVGGAIARILVDRQRADTR